MIAISGILEKLKKRLLTVKGNSILGKVKKATWGKK